TLMYLTDLYMDHKKYKEAEAPLKSALTLCEGVIHVNAQAVPTNGAPTPSLSAESAQAEIFAAHGLRCLAKIFHVRGRRAEASLLTSKAIAAYTGNMSVSIKHGRPDLASLGNNNNAAAAQAKREIVKEAATVNNLFYKITDATGDFIKVKHS